MKNYTPILAAVVCVFSFSGFAQRNSRLSSEIRVESAQLMSNQLANSELDNVVSYYVKEKTNMNFGGSTITYEVSNVNLISTRDLGPNNSRVITPKFGKAKAKSTTGAVAVKEQVAAIFREIPTDVKPIVINSAPNEKYINIDILSTYERVIDKGYKSADMLKRVANSRFFDGDLTIAAKWYTQLFELTTDLEPVYYYRYAQALNAIGQTEKSNEMMKIFKIKDR